LNPFNDVTIVFVPGLRDHMPDHWQSHMAEQIPGSITVEPVSENKLSREVRVAALNAALEPIEGDVIVAAHSGGVLILVEWAKAPTRQIRGALLATPADVETPLPPGYPLYEDLAANGWIPIPREPLPFPAIVAASRNDPLADFGKIEALAGDWGAELHDAGKVGHLNPASGFGPWPAGLPLLERLATTRQT
jgi:uncharacterized protein